MMGSVLDCLSIEQLEEVSLFKKTWTASSVSMAISPVDSLIHETVRRMINALVSDLIETTSVNISRANPGALR